jgi:hypothetical protein
MTLNDRFHADRSRFPQQAASKSARGSCSLGTERGHSRCAYAYALTGSAFSTLMLLAPPHLEVFVRCIFQKG